MRIILLVHKDLVPPESLDDYGEDDAIDCKGEFDVKDALLEMGHDVLVVGLDDELKPLREAVRDFSPKVVFNMLEEFKDQVIFDQHVISYLEVLGAKYTGCNPRGLTLARDKALTKKILSYHRILVPKFTVARKKERRPSINKLGFPIIVKPLSEEASLSISKNSIVTNESALWERVDYVHEQFNADVILEQYIEGREVYVGIVGNKRLETFSPWELIIKNRAPGEPNIATRMIKFNRKYQKKKGVTTKAASKLSDEQMQKLSSYSKRVYKALHMSGYGRMDYRINDKGDIYLMEANPNPNLEYGEDFSESASHDGVGYLALMKRIINCGLRYCPGE